MPQTSPSHHTCVEHACGLRPATTSEVDVSIQPSIALQAAPNAAPGF